MPLVPYTRFLQDDTTAEDKIAIYFPIMAPIAMVMKAYKGLIFPKDQSRVFMWSRTIDALPSIYGRTVIFFFISHFSHSFLFSFSWGDSSLTISSTGALGSSAERSNKSRLLDKASSIASSKAWTFVVLCPFFLCGTGPVARRQQQRCLQSSEVFSSHSCRW